MAKKKVVKKKKVEPKVAKNSDVLPVGISNEEFLDVSLKLDDAIQCLKHYTKKDQIGDLANPAIELLIKLGVMEDVPKD